MCLPKVNKCNWIKKLLVLISYMDISFEREMSSLRLVYFSIFFKDINNLKFATFFSQDLQLRSCQSYC